MPTPERTDASTFRHLSNAECLALVRHFLIERGRAPRLMRPSVELHISSPARRYFGSIQAMFTQAWTRDLMIAAGVNFIKTHGRLPAGPSSAIGARADQTEFWHAYGLPLQEPILATFDSIADYQRTILEIAPKYGVHPKDREALLSYAVSRPGHSLSDEQMRMNGWGTPPLLTATEQGAAVKAKNHDIKPPPLLQLAANDLSSPIAETWRDAAKTIASIEESKRPQRALVASTMPVDKARSLILSGQVNGFLWSAPRRSLSCEADDPDKPFAEGWTLALDPESKMVSVSIVQIYQWDGGLLARRPWAREPISVDRAAKLISSGAILPVSEKKVLMRTETHPAAVVAHRILCAWGKSRSAAEPLELWDVKFEFPGSERTSSDHKAHATAQTPSETALT